MDCVDWSLPGSSVHGILQAWILEWVCISFSRRSSPPRDITWVSCIIGRFFTIWATREVHLGYQTPAKYMICKYFLQFYRLFFYFLDGVLWHKLWWHPVFLFFFFCLFCFTCALDVLPKKLLPNAMLQRSVFYNFKSFISLFLMFRSLIHSELFLCMVWEKDQNSFICIQLYQHH